MVAERVTLKDVARLAGVHPGTASRALSSDPKMKLLVNAETAKRVRKIARELNYEPDPAAQSLKTRKSQTVGVLIPDLTNPLFPPMIRGLEDCLAESGLVVLLGNTDDDRDRQRMVINGMLSRRVDALVLATARRKDPEIVNLGDHGIPIVLINRVVENHAVPSVSADDVAGIKTAVAHLVELGHRRIAHLAGPQDLSTGANRLMGYYAGMESAGLEVTKDMVVYADSFSFAEGVKRCKELMQKSLRPTAMVVSNDMLAIGCYQGLEELGLRCPDDVSIVAFNDAPFSDRLAPPLTSVSFAHYQVGFEAAQLVIDRIQSPQSPTKIILLPPELVVRKSTSPIR